jgi:hypothetical protein
MYRNCQTIVSTYISIDVTQGGGGGHQMYLKYKKNLLMKMQ